MIVKFNFVTMTKDEPTAFRLISEIERQMAEQDRILIIDDFSSAEYCARLGSLSEADPKRIRIIQHALDENFSAHRNSCKPWVPEGEWVLMLDSDEMIMPGFVDAVRREIEAVPNADAVAFERFNSYIDDTKDETPPLPDYKRVFPEDYQTRAWVNRPAIGYVNRVHEQLVGFHRRIFLKGPPFTILHHRWKGPRRYDYYYAKFNLPF